MRIDLGPRLLLRKTCVYSLEFRRLRSVGTICSLRCHTERWCSLGTLSSVSKETVIRITLHGVTYGLFCRVLMRK